MKSITSRLFIVAVFMIAVFIFLIFARNLWQAESELQRFTFQSYHMGSMFTIILYAENDSIANAASNAAFDRIEELDRMMSDYIEDSELNLLSGTSGSGEAVLVSEPLFDVLMQSVQISELTGGLFDVTAGPLTEYWRIIRSKHSEEHITQPLIDTDELEDRLGRVGYHFMKIDKQKGAVELLKPGMKLDLGGIAKGYAAEDALNVLAQYGIYSALVDAGGDISAGDPPPDRYYWETAVPKEQRNGETEYITLHVKNATITTSGDMYQYVEIDGVRYSHIINPKTGLGSTEQIQATVISANGAYADALASALTLMDPEEGIQRINKIEGTEAMVFKRADENIRKWMSNDFEQFLPR